MNMSYLRPLETDSLPQLTESASVRRSRTVEEELASHRRGIPPRAGYLQFSEVDVGSGSVNRRVVIELQEQVKVFRDELRKKDALIQHLVSLESAPAVAHSSERFERLYHADKEALERARSDLAALQVKYDRMTNQLKEYEGHVEAKDIKIKELETVLETNRESETQLSDLVQSLRARVHELEEQVGSIQTVSNRGEYTISTLQKDLQEANDKIVQLETRIRELLDEQESNALKVSEAQQKAAQLVAQMAKLLNITEESFDAASSDAVDVVIQKLTDLTQENLLLKGKEVTLVETLSNIQVESKANRETIMRLVSEMEREQKATSKFSTEIETLRVDRDAAVAAQADMGREIVLLKERLESGERVLEATKAELQLRDQRLAALDLEMKANSQSVHSSATGFQLFREHLTNLLLSVFSSVDTSEEGLKEALGKLVAEFREHKVKLQNCEEKLTSVTEQLEKNVKLHRDLAHRAKQYETDARDLAGRLHCAEGELAAGDVLRESFKTDKERYLFGLQKLVEIMKMDRACLDVGLDMSLDAIMSRAEQLVKLEADALAERTTHVYKLQRKVKSQKEQLESKDLHLDLLRKKLTALEERVHGRVELQKSVQAEGLRVKKLENLVEKYKLQLTDARQEIQNLKAQLLGTTELKLRTLEQRKDVEELATQVAELEELRRKQTHKIATLKEEVASNETQLQEKQVVADNAVQALTSELRTTSNALEAVKLREKQLLDFRGVVSHMLGLDMNTLAVPDYEIITRLEKLIRAHHTTALTTMGLEEALADAECNYLSQVQVADPVVRRSRERSRRKAAMARIRTRSLSPA